ncbi:MAG TPA: hypothetical protein VN238_20470 [Solirubrobacteraceae bacterium]|nr:hypothetical protein [Solirubrobacteraceae bacterium]
MNADVSVDVLYAAIGRATASAAALEATLRVAVLQLRAERDGVDKDLERLMLSLSRRPGGEQLRELRALGFDADVSDRVADVIGRRNRMIHHPVTQPELGPGLLGRDVHAAVTWVNAIREDCDDLAQEILLGSLDPLLRVLGTTVEGLAEFLGQRELDEVADPRVRADLGALRALVGGTSQDRSPAVSSPSSGHVALARRRVAALLACDYPRPTRRVAEIAGISARQAGAALRWLESNGLAGSVLEEHTFYDELDRPYPRGTRTWYADPTWVIELLCSVEPFAGVLREMGPGGSGRIRRIMSDDAWSVG